MNVSPMVAKTALIACLSLILAATASAQPASNLSQQSPVSQHHQMMTDMMKDMSKEMTSLTEQMSRGGLTPEQNRQMAVRMERMSNMMHRMSGLQDRPAMKDAESQKQMATMRKQMDEMMRDPSANSKTK